ncbi:Hsp20/alpha crystallin family protein [Methylocystis parvus]|uniref:Hsp20/alpha crystallin family protein n=1 Tax=Methylocystis parvus TaxID=134 RepID=A0A6B8MA60_9HYPH|nr:Hsp20/alpha crystallin family protein [Methylocystis parvus]QGM99315.1 Hsp20/alpha crystallin family protein [Methylocystis parvus]WBK00296.1 Hsp20/alpha crystallin family protein [Methylocystis parvus OBBP]
MTEERTPAKRDGGGALVPPDIWDWRPFEALRRQLDRFFDEAPVQRRSGDFEPFERFMGWQGTPPVDFVERDNEYEVTAELPGLDQKDVEVKVANGALVVHGEKKMEREENKEGMFFSERRYGSFKRSFRLPENADIDKIAAHFEKGVLKITLPKTAQTVTQEKKIDIAVK